MQKSYIVKSPINFANYGFFVRVGDILVHEPVNNNRLTVYRNGSIVKAITQTALGMAALLKQGFISEVSQSTVSAPPKHVEPVKKLAPIPEDKEATRKEIKRKARAVQEDMPVKPLEEDEQV